MMCHIATAKIVPPTAPDVPCTVPKLDVPMTIPLDTKLQHDIENMTKTYMSFRLLLCSVISLGGFPWESWDLICAQCL